MMLKKVMLEKVVLEQDAPLSTGQQEIDKLAYLLHVLKLLASSPEVRQKIKQVTVWLLFAIYLQSVKYSSLFALNGKQKTKLQALIQEREEIKGKISEEIFSTTKVMPDFYLLVAHFGDLLIIFFKKFSKLIQKFFIEDVRFGVFFYNFYGITLSKRF